MITNTHYISSWKSKGLSAESIKLPTTSDNSLTPTLNYYGTKTRVKFTGSCLNLFGAVTVTKNADIVKYGYSGYGIGFDRRRSFSLPGGRYGQNVLIFGVDMSFSAHIDKKKDILVLGIGPTQGLEHTLIAEKMYFINFTVTKKEFCLKVH